MKRKPLAPKGRQSKRRRLHQLHSSYVDASAHAHTHERVDSDYTE